MSVTYTIELTPIEDLSLQYITRDKETFVQDLLKHQIKFAMDEIVRIVVQKCTEDNIPIPGTKDEIIQLGFDQEWVVRAAGI